MMSEDKEQFGRGLVTANSEDITVFDYAALDAETRIVVQQKTGEIKDLFHRTGENIVSIGKWLVEVKSKLNHGQFESWIENELGLSSQTARNFMNVADVYGEKQNYFAFAPTILYKLSARSTPEKARNEVEQRAKAGEEMTVGKVTAIIQESKPKPLPPVTYSKPIDDGYVDDVPAQQVEPPAASALPIVSNPFKAVVQIAPNGHKEPARPVPGATLAGDPLAGAHLNGANGASAPVIPGIGKAPYKVEAAGLNLYIIKDHGSNTVMKIEGCEKMVALVLAGLNTPKEESHDDTLPFATINRLNLNLETLNDLIKTYGKDKVSAILHFLRETEYTPESPMEYIKDRLDEIKGIRKKSKKKSTAKDKPKAEANPNAPFIVEILATYISESGAIDPDIYAKPSERNKAEKLHLAGVTPKHVQAYIRAMREDKFWKDKAISLDKILKEIGAWLDVHCKGWNGEKAPVYANNVTDLGAIYANLKPRAVNS